jgi:glycosyltransferase involved in cell wall biosynthesis
MRLAILGSRGYPSTYGGYETLVRFLAPFLRDRGHEVTVYCRFPSPKDGSRHWVEDGIRCIATRGVDTTSASTLSFGLTSSVDAARRRFDAVLVLNIANGFWLPILRAARIPTAVNTDGIEWERGKWGPVARRAFRSGAQLTARCADVLICDSEAIGAVWRDRFGRGSTFIPYGAPVVPHGGDDKLRDVGLEGRAYVLAVARLVPENNVELTLDALDILGEDAPVGVVVGSAPPDSRIGSRLGSLHGQGRIIWLGHVYDQELLTQLWMNSTAYVHGHSVGGTNPALLQAMGAGAPTLALDTAFNREVLPVDEQLFDSNPAELARKLRAVLSSELRRHEMAERGREIVSASYSWGDVCSRYARVLEELSAAGSARDH